MPSCRSGVLCGPWGAVVSKMFVIPIALLELGWLFEVWRLYSGCATVKSGWSCTDNSAP